jgi:hypothetical protein
MDVKENARGKWVWAILILQAVSFVSIAWASLYILLFWQKYFQHPAQVFAAIAWTTTEAIAVGASLVGLWRGERWGWILAVLTSAVSCLMMLNNLLQYPEMMLRYPRWLVSSIRDFATLAILLHPPVRLHFLRRPELPRSSAVPGVGYGVKLREPRQKNQLERLARVLIYYLAAVAMACVVTAFSLTILLGEKAGGGKGFLLVLAIGLMIGSVPSFLFVLLLTFAARRFGPNRLAVWSLTGVLLAPGLTLCLGALFGTSESRSMRIIGVLFTGPVWLFRAWWLTIPTGLAVAYLCFQIFPWSFGESGPR